MTLFAKPAEPAPPSPLYQVAWTDARGEHAVTGLDWNAAKRKYHDLDHIVGNYAVHITAQGGAG